MIDTSIAAAYAAQYARKSGTEPVADYFESNVGTPYTYINLDDISPWLNENDSLKTKIKSYGWELHIYEEGPYRLYAVPGHTPGGTRLVNKISYCGHIDFKDSKKASEVNIRNIVIAAKELVRRCDTCSEFIEGIQNKFTKLPTGELSGAVAERHYEDTMKEIANQYGYDIESVDRDQVSRALAVLENLGSIVPIGRPFVKIGARIARHWIENVLRMCSDVENEYLSTDSFGVAASMYMEDRFDGALLKDGLQLPEIFETLEYFDKY